MGRPRLTDEIDAEFAGLALTRSCPAHGTAYKGYSRKLRPTAWGLLAGRTAAARRSPCPN
jgi:hypothetical protein